MQICLQNNKAKLEYSFKHIKAAMDYDIRHLASMFRKIFGVFWTFKRSIILNDSS